LGAIKAVKALTDVTGFGLLGHLTEMCEGSNLSAEIESAKIPRFDAVNTYIFDNCIPGGTHRNWESYSHHVKLNTEEEKLILCDPQTNGGLLIAVEESAVPQVIELLKENDIHTQPFGRLVKRGNRLITVV